MAEKRTPFESKLDIGVIISGNGWHPATLRVIDKATGKQILNVVAIDIHFDRDNPHATLTLQVDPRMSELHLESMPADYIYLVPNNGD